ncbi:MAG TPA: 3-hydroxyacyl-CoA dehydrogenase [Xanthobacteraceae bacterium]|nr:3-hydroxyacyl-CoA dehydrogenase [Xanthobacteraceae bacterium]
MTTVAAARTADRPGGAQARPAAGVTIGIVGAGTMGCGIAQVAAAAGHAVLLFDANPNAVEQAVHSVGSIFRRAVERGKVAAAVADDAIARVKGVPRIEDVGAADLIIEAVVDDLEIKRRLFAMIEPVAHERTVLATNTASLSVAAVAASCARPERVAGLHFFNPVPLTRLVEVVRAPRTAAATMARIVEIVSRLGHTPIVVEDTPGFVVNVAQSGVVGEALRILEEGVAPPHVVDAVARNALGFRLGPFEMLDLQGLDTIGATQQALFNQFFGEPRLRPSPLASTRIAAGLLGRKSGQGFYRYENGQAVLPEPGPKPSDTRRPIWVSGTRPQLAAKVATALSGAIDLAAGPNTPNYAVQLVTPLGLDATQAATDEKLDPRRVVAVDTLFPLDRHVVLMPTPSTDPEALDAVHCGFLRAGRSVTIIEDSPGFIAQRLVAMTVAVAASLAERRTAAPDDIDRAVTMALGQQTGPLALGDRIGPRVIVEILQNLFRVTADPRWRIPPLLRRCALLGQPLSPTAQTAS